MNEPYIEYLEPAGKNIFPEGTVITQIANNLQFTEGPLWHRDGFLLFSDTPTNTIKRLQADNTITTFIENSGCKDVNNKDLSDMAGSNALAYDTAGHILVCQHGNHAVGRLQQHTVTPWLTSYQNKPFNSPNDLVVSSKGFIYFSDPPYGLTGQVLHPAAFQPHSGVYLHRNEETILLFDEMAYPNGLCLSPDEQYLYVSSNYKEDQYLLRFSIRADGTLANKQAFLQQNGDGVKSDVHGFIYLATDEGVLVISPEGVRVARLCLLESPTNLAWGGPQKNLLYITARGHLYSVPASTTGFMATDNAD